MKINTRNLITAAVVGALYAVLTMVLAPISYGALQFRVSEVLCILPFFMPFTAWGLFVGCIVANLMSTATVLPVVYPSYHRGERMDDNAIVGMMTTIKPDGIAVM